MRVSTGTGEMKAVLRAEQLCQMKLLSQCSETPNAIHTNKKPAESSKVCAEVRAECRATASWRNVQLVRSRGVGAMAPTLMYTHTRKLEKEESPISGKW